MNKILNSLKSSKLFLKVGLLFFPFLVRVSPAPFQVPKLAYRFLSIFPFALSSQASKCAYQCSKYSREKYHSILLEVVACRFNLNETRDEFLWVHTTKKGLDYCDELLISSHSTDLTAQLLFEVLELLYHPSIHQGLETSPFIENPSLVDELLSYSCIDKITSTDRIEKYSRFNSDSDLSGKKILILTDTNFNFMSEILKNWSEDPSTEIRSRDLSSDQQNSSWWHPLNTIKDRLSGLAPTVPIFLKDDLEWADIIFLEWSQALAARLSGTEFKTKIVIRLHKYEAFISTPILTAWQNIAALILITPFMEVLLSRTIPEIHSRTKLELVPNVIDLKKFLLPKTVKPYKALGLIQFNSVIKDPNWALDVFEYLIYEDASWKLFLVGSSHLPNTGKPLDKKYFDIFSERVHAFGDSVVQTGHRKDLENFLTNIDVILSSSMIEGAPVSVWEAVASGAFPVIRNWPIVSRIAGAQKLYPKEWIVNTPKEAAQRILSEFHAKETIGAQKFVIENYDSTVTIKKLDEVINNSLSN